MMGDTAGSCPSKLCVPTLRELVRNLIAMVQGEWGMLVRIRVCAGLAIL